MKHVSFVLFPGFSMTAYCLAVDSLKMTNRAAGNEMVRWDTRITGHAAVEADNGLVIAPDPANWEGADTVDLVLVIAGQTLDVRIPNGFRSFLETVESNGGRIGGLDTGTVILARGGFLSGREAVLHGGAVAEDIPGPFPDIALSDKTHLLTGDRLTAAGGIAVVAALQSWIGDVVSLAVANTVAQGMSRGRLSPPASSSESEAPTDPVIADMESHMRANLSDPLALVALAGHLGMTRKALRGRCMRTIGKRPSERYLELRLTHGADLLRNTAMPVSEIAAATGFETLAGFSRSIKQNLGVSPSAVRKMARAARLVSQYA